MTQNYDLNQAVITSKFVINESSPIMHIYHDEDDDWQFLGNEEISEADAMVVSLEQIIKRDLSIKEIVSSIPMGYHAFRKSLNGKWTIIKY